MSLMVNRAGRGIMWEWTSVLGRVGLVFVSTFPSARFLSSPPRYTVPFARRQCQGWDSLPGYALPCRTLTEHADPWEQRGYSAYRRRAKKPEDCAHPDCRYKFNWSCNYRLCMRHCKKLPNLCGCRAHQCAKLHLYDRGELWAAGMELESTEAHRVFTPVPITVHFEDTVCAREDADS